MTCTMPLYDKKDLIPRLQRKDHYLLLLCEAGHGLNFFFDSLGAGD